MVYKGFPCWQTRYPLKQLEKGFKLFKIKICMKAREANKAWKIM